MTDADNESKDDVADEAKPEADGEQATDLSNRYEN
jgi:hypothetical protein